jgi:hypothetical protein
MTIGLTYRFHIIGGRNAIRCLLCDAISELPGDVHNRYCGRCHLFHDVVAAARAMFVAGATHDCGEWKTAGRPPVCAVCKNPL